MCEKAINHPHLATFSMLATCDMDQKEELLFVLIIQGLVAFIFSKKKKKKPAPCKYPQHVCPFVEKTGNGCTVQGLL